MSEIRSLAEAKAHLSELVARAGTEHERITVTVHGRPTAVLMAVDDLEALEETLAVLSDSAALRALGEADSELARGEGEDQGALLRPCEPGEPLRERSAVQAGHCTHRSPPTR